MSDQLGDGLREKDYRYVDAPCNGRSNRYWPQPAHTEELTPQDKGKPKAMQQELHVDLPLLLSFGFDSDGDIENDES